MTKTTKVLLVCPQHNMKREFEITHAERLLMMGNNGGWQLPENSNFEFSKDYGIRYKRHKKTDYGAKERGGD
jgi:hypothetical protein|nr:MAG TPA: hypothetical protein [Caudoviricetes sp.]